MAETSAAFGSGLPAAATDSSAAVLNWTPSPLAACTDAVAAPATQATPRLSSPASATPADAALSGAPVDTGLQVIAGLIALDQAWKSLEADLGQAFLGSVLAHPIDWVTSFVVGAFKELWRMIEGTFNLILAVQLWLARVTLGLEIDASVGIAELVKADIMGQGVPLHPELDPSGMLKPVIAGLREIDAKAEGILDTLAWAADHQEEVAAAALSLLRAALPVLTEAISPRGGLHDDLIAAVHDSKTSGALSGAVAINVVLLGVPGADEAVAAADVTEALSMTARVAETAEEVSVASKVLDSDKVLADLGDLLKAIREAFAKSRARLSDHVTERKLDLVKDLPGLTELSTQTLRMAQEQTVTQLFTLRGTTGRIADIVATARPFNLRSKLLFLLDVARTEGLYESAEEPLALSGATLAEQLLDGAHLIDGRFLDYFPPEARALLEWKSPEDMPGVLATASEHRRSWPAYFAKLLPRTITEGGVTETIPAAPADLNEAASITNYFFSRIIKVDKAGRQIGAGTPVADAVRIGPSTKASEIVEAHLSVWKNKRFTTAGGVATRGAIEELERILALLRSNGL